MRKRIPLSACQTIASVGTGSRENGATSTTSPSAIRSTAVPVKKAGVETGAEGNGIRGSRLIAVAASSAAPASLRAGARRRSPAKTARSTAAARKA
ncbi:MAG: hypothetical protein E6I76_16015 [Chloroflexi bacterium]|nr:MAG: hypothetical protein E6I76_16015 [Chloroflexota bacterium]